MSLHDTIIHRFEDVSSTETGWRARCPAHDDESRGLVLTRRRDGSVDVECSESCDPEAIVRSVGLTLSDLTPSSEPDPPHPRSDISSKDFATANDAVLALGKTLGRQSAYWAYLDVHGQPVGLVVRWDGPGGKEFRPVSRHGDGWRIGAMPVPRPLYHLPELTQASRVIVCEGEKAADAARGLGFTATTSSCGPRAAAYTDWRPLAGKEVWVLPDNDEDGRAYADAVVNLLTSLSPPPVVRVVELDGLPDQGDLVDWVATRPDATPDELRARLEALAASAEPCHQAEHEDLAFRPFPVDALPEPIRTFVAVGARSINCDPSYIAVPLLCALGAAIGMTRKLELKPGWEAPAILWGILVGESGTAKSPAFRLALDAAKDRERIAQSKNEDKLAAYKTALRQWEEDGGERDGKPVEKPTPPVLERYALGDCTLEALLPILKDNPRGVLCQYDELAGWFGSFDKYSKGNTGGDVATWLTMFSGETLSADRKGGDPKTIHVPTAAVWVTGGIQPGILARHLGRKHRESGLAARFLLALPPRRPKRWTDDVIDPEAKARVSDVITRLYELRPATGPDGTTGPIVVRLSAEARRCLFDFINRHGDEQTDLEGDLSAAWSKLEEYAARLALVLHFTRWAAGDPTLKSVTTVDVESVREAIRLTEWFKHGTRRVYDELDRSEEDQARRKLIEWLARKGRGVTAREVQQGCRWLKEPGAAEKALGTLAKDGMGRWREVPSGSDGGRATRVFELNQSSTAEPPPHHRAA